jgi:hypothetical protein
MNILLKTPGDPTWQVLALVITLATPLLMVAVRAHAMHAPEHEMRRDTLTILLMSGVAVALRLPDAQRRGQAALHHHPYPLRCLHLHRHPSQSPHRLLGSPVL